MLRLLIALLLLLISTQNVEAKDKYFWIDRDGDGYGVNSPLGPDCDDTNATKHTPIDHADALNYIPHSGRVFYISTTGNNSTGVANDVTHPYASWAGIPSHQPDDTIVYRGGTYVLSGGVTFTDYAGTTGHPVTVMGYPGERVILDRNGTNNAIGAMRSGNITFKWLECINGADGGDFGEASNTILDQCVFRNNTTWGVSAMQGLTNFTIRDCVAHHNTAEHGFYLGARDKPNSNVQILGNISYWNGRHGFQHNGRVNGLNISGNIFHTNQLGGISIIIGAYNSHITNNLLFNNNKQGIIQYIYDYSATGQVPYDIHDNVIENNIIWIGRYNNGNGTDAPDGYMPMEFTLSNYNNHDEIWTDYDIYNITTRKNVFVTYSGPAVRFNQFKLAESGNITTNNIFHRLDGQSYFAALTLQSNEILDGTEDLWSTSGGFAFWLLSSAQAKWSGMANNTTVDPLFTSASVNYSTTPELFDFDLPANSPALSLGISQSPPGAAILDYGGASIPGVCGASSGLALSSAPVTNLCSAGTASAVSGTGPWAWTCAGSGGGSTASCGATLLEIPSGGASAVVACPVMAGFR